MVKSLVTTDLVKRIVESQGGGRSKDVLTGFKYIAEEIASLEGPKGDHEYFLFGCEESYGYLTLPPQVRDKDAISSALMSVEMMCHWSSKGLTLKDRLDQIYDRWGGFSTEAVFAKDYEGASGKDKMTQIMAGLRKLNVGDELAGHTITIKQDLLDGKQTEFPPSDVLILFLEGGDKIVVRPSGTEPKIKYYFFFSAEGTDRTEFEQNLGTRIDAYKAALS